MFFTVTQFNLSFSSSFLCFFVFFLNFISSTRVKHKIIIIIIIIIIMIIIMMMMINVNDNK